MKQSLCTPEQWAKEIERRKKACAQLVAFFRERPLERVPIAELAKRFGYGGFRTRVSEARTYVFEPEGGVLENELDYCTIDGEAAVLSYYTYKPYTPVARSAETEVKGQRELFPPQSYR